MRLTRVFVDAPLEAGALLPLPPGPAQHLARVLRAAAGDALVVFNGRGGEYAANIEALHREQVSVRIGAHHAIERESPLTTTLLQGIARGEKMDQIVQKATELGVTRVVPVLTQRSNVRLDAAGGGRKQEHWRAVGIGACEQCGRNRVPEVTRPMQLPAALAEASADIKLVLSPDDAAASLASQVTALGPGTHSVALLVGPEGGFDAEEVDLARMHGFISCRLGPRVLRTETAAPAALAALQLACGDLGDALSIALNGSHVGPESSPGAQAPLMPVDTIATTARPRW
jgi:16S rRNA (uracil1498-N3)-methyltransferase